MANPATIIIGEKVMDSVISPGWTEKMFEEARMRAVEFKQKCKKTGRNDPCPCGSQKKFKKCCLRKYE